MMDDFVGFLLQRMEESRRSFRDNLPLTFLPNPTPTRVRLERARVVVGNKFTRYRRLYNHAYR